MRQAIIWTNDDSIHWRIYAALGEDGLIKMIHDDVQAGKRSALLALCRVNRIMQIRTAPSTIVLARIVNSLLTTF